MKCLAAGLVAVVLAGCGGADTHSTSDTERAGLEEVHARIEALDDCGELQAEFDQAMENAEAREAGDPARDASLAYAKTADARMREADCY